MNMEYKFPQQFYQGLGKYKNLWRHTFIEN